MSSLNVLLFHVQKNLVPERIRTAPEIGHLTVITEPGHAQAYGPETDVRLVESVRDLECVRREVAEVLRERRIDHFLSPFEQAQPVIGFLREHFGIPGTGFSTANAFAHKYVMKERLTQAGLPVAGFRIAHGLSSVPAAADELGWPVVVKPVIGGGALDVNSFADKEEFKDFRTGRAAAELEDLRFPLIVEQRVDVREEFHCDAVVHDGKVVFSATSRYFTPVLSRNGSFGSHLLPESDRLLPRIRDLNTAAVQTLGLEAGVTHLELFHTADDELLIGEIAGRPAGGKIPEAVKMQTGIDLWGAFVETSLGHEPTIEPQQADGVVVHCYLPVRPGRIVRLTSAQELARLPHVTQVDMQRVPGDIVPDRLISVAASGVVFLQVPDQQDIDKAIRQVYDRFEIEVEVV